MTTSWQGGKVSKGEDTLEATGVAARPASQVSTTERLPGRGGQVASTPDWLALPDPYFGPSGHVPQPVEGMVLREAYEQPGEYARLDDTGRSVGSTKLLEEPCHGCGKPTTRRVIGAVVPLAHPAAVMRFGLVLTPCCEQCERGAQ